MNNQSETLSQKGAGWIKQHPILSIVGIIFIIGLIGSIVDPVEPKHEPKIQGQSVQQSIFDTPNLLGKNIDEIEALIGKSDSREPTSEQVILTTEWSKEFRKDNVIMTVTYDHKTRLVKDFFISAPNEIYESRDKDRMMNITNTTGTDSRYSVEFVKDLKHPSRFTGLLVTPK